MGRNNERNIKKHNDKLHKEQDKKKAAKLVRIEKLKQIVQKFNEQKKQRKRLKFRLVNHFQKIIFRNNGDFQLIGFF